MAFDSGRDSDTGRHGTDRPAGGMMAAGIAIGSGLGVALGVALDVLPLGIAIGTGMGVAIGAALEQGRGGKAAEQYGTQRRSMWLVVALGLALLIGLVGAFVFLRLR